MFSFKYLVLYVCSIIFGYFKSSLSKLNILPCGHQFQVFHSSLICTKHQVFYNKNLMIFVLLLYFCIDHIDPYFICRTVQNLNKDNLRTYIIGGRGIKSVPKLLHFLPIHVAILSKLVA